MERPNGAWATWVSFNKTSYTNYFSAVSNPNGRAGAWVDAVIEAERVRDKHDPNRFGDGAWQPPLTLKQITLKQSNPNVWNKVFSFRPDDNADKERSWMQAWEASKAGKADTQEPNKPGQRRS